MSQRSFRQSLPIEKTDTPIDAGPLTSGIVHP